MTATPVSPSRSQENPPGVPSEAPVPEAQGETPPGIEDTVGTPTTADDRLSPLLGTPSAIIVEVDEKTQASSKREVQERITTKEHPQVVVHDMPAPLPLLLSPDIEPATLQGEDRTMLIDDQEKERGEVGDEEAEVEREVEVVEGLILEEKDELTEEREGEGEVAFKDDLFAETLGKEIDVTETRHETAEQTAVVDVPAVHARLGSPALLEAEVEAAVDDGESSGEEPLHVSRRSTRRRISTLSPVQPLQTRGKTRRQRAESPPMKTKEEPEADGMEEADSVQQQTPSVDFDQDTSPTPEIITRRREGKRKASFVEGVESLRERKRVRDDSEPADDDEAGASSHALRGRRPGTRSDAFKRFQNVIGMLHSQISQHRNGNIFHNPIKNSEAPDYHEIVKRPMDLKTIKMKVKDGSIANSLEYQKEIFLMFANALMYNRPGSDVHTMAEDMMIESEGHIHAFRQTEGLVRGAHRT
ncbi:hypothetical protein FPV67DRAFT_417395 [Lyophyllum atratum]|nr:hypothetical protein FPV67DRAFT_417395 [Lyophyllum atratum]